MLRGTETVELEQLKKRGWSISAIARHLDRDRTDMECAKARQVDLLGQVRVWPGDL